MLPDFFLYFFFPVQQTTSGLSQGHGCTRSSDGLVSCDVPRWCEARPGGVRCRVVVFLAEVPRSTSSIQEGLDRPIRILRESATCGWS